MHQCAAMRLRIKATTVCPECSCSTNHSYVTYGAYHTSRSIGYRSVNGFCLRWRFWSTSASTGVHHPIWLMTAAQSANAGPVLDRRRTWWSWTFHRPERRSATDRLLSMDRASGTVYRRQFVTHHCHSLFFVTASRLICSSNSCGICDSERTPDK